MRPLSIVHALPFFDPATRFGGPVAQLRRLCRELADRGHQVSVVTTDMGIGPDLARNQWVDRDGYRVWYTPAHPLGRWAPYYAPRVRRPLDECLPGADVLHLSLSFTHVNIVGRRRAAAHGVPYVYTPRSCLDPVRLRQRPLLKRGFLALHERRIIRDAAAVHVLTDVERRQAQSQGARPEQCVIIPNGAEFDPDADFPDGSLFRDLVGIGPNVPLVLFMGRLHRVKGLDLLVDAFVRLRTGMPAARLVIAGPDEGEQSDLQTRIRRLGLDDAVHLAGPVDGEVRRAAFRAADVFALTSHSEGMPNAVLEACAAGTPAVITEPCNLPEIEACSAGRVVPVDDTSVAAALRELLADPAKLKATGDNARRMIRERFAWPGVISNLEHLYRRLSNTPADPEVETKRAA